MIKAKRKPILKRYTAAGKITLFFMMSYRPFWCNLLKEKVRCVAYGSRMYPMFVFRMKVSQKGSKE